VSNSPTNPLPSALFPLPEARPNSLQDIDRSHIFDVEMDYSGAEHRFFPALREMPTTMPRGQAAHPVDLSRPSG
jgi:hypothetical protein